MIDQPMDGSSGSMPNPYQETHMIKPIRWNADVELIPNQEGKRIRALVRNTRWITEFVYIVARDGDGCHFLSTDGTIDGMLPFHLVIAWRYEDGTTGARDA